MTESVFEELRKFVAPEIVFGPGARKLVGRYARNLGARRALLVSDPGVVRAGWTGEAAADLAEAGVPASIFTGVSPNPRAEEVMAGAAYARVEGCDLLVAVGGGSVIDTAKGIGIVSANGGHILEYEGVDRVPLPIPPLICVPTTGGTSADVSQFAIFSDPVERTKVAVISKAVVPDIALVDPVTLTTLEPRLAASTGMDALVHAIEAFASNAHSPLTDLHALQAIRLVWPNLLPSVKNPRDVGLRTQVMLGSLEAGLAFSNASLGAVHALAHSLGGLLDLPHGECNALLLEPVLRFNYPSAAERYDQVGAAMGLDLRGMRTKEKKAALLAALDHLRVELGLDASLGVWGVHRSDVPELAEHASLDPCAVTNPRPVARRDLEVLYEEAL
ncbi:MAG TPA: alcohol dehydrogenase-like regulatory protein ErcA [Myxococcales bacterium]|jgi:alcohol dehydrogenase class IV